MQDENFNAAQESTGRTILGIDPGYARMGWGVISISPKKGGNSTVKCLGFGCVETPKDEEMGTRLAYLNDALAQIIGHYKPHDIAVEELFFSKNVKTAMLVAHARGIIMMRASMHTGRVFEYRPNAIKLAVAMNQKADKKEMCMAVSQILNFAHAPKLDDTADALAIAITHATTTL
jgi:crossover junction endodeoxyribonuclease RuvC